MAILHQLASALNRRDEEPNLQLAIQLSQCGDTDVRDDIQELVDNLTNKKKDIRSDCIKVLYEIGAIKPAYIVPYVAEFKACLAMKDNRIVWGAMTALNAVAQYQPQAVAHYANEIIRTVKNGSVITQDRGVSALCHIAMNTEKDKQKILPFLFSFLAACKPKDVPRHAENIINVTSINEEAQQLRMILQSHVPQLNANQLRRVQKLIHQLDEE